MIIYNIFFTKMLIAFLLGASLYFTLILNKFNWVKNPHHLLTFFLLPIIAFSITTAISDNLALSLGMIGALSIIRFRNPVRSPLELTCYFFLITIGIVVNVTYKNAFLLTFLIILIIFGVNISSKFIPFLKNYINLSSEKKSIIELRFDRSIKDLDNSKNLLFHSLSKEGDKHIYSYRLQLNNLLSLEEIIKFKPIDYAIYKEDSEN